MTLHQSAQKTQRLEYIDIAKGIGIILVVIGHCVAKDSFIRNYIYSFHMPLFFFLSGFCFDSVRNPEFIPFLKKKSMTLLLPCIYFVCIILILSVLLLPQYYTVDKLTQTLPQAYWFVFILFVSELVYFGVNKVLKSIKWRAVFLVICLCLSILLHDNDILLPYNLSCIPISVFFYGSGHLLKKSLGGVKHTITILLLVIPAASVYFTKHTLELSENMIPSPELYYVLISFIGIAGILSACNELSEKAGRRIKQLFLFLGKNTFVILLTHMFYLALSFHYVRPLIHYKPVYKLTEQVIIWILAFITIQIVNRKAKWLVGKK